MNIRRIEEIQKETAYPDSISVQQALLKVWNECEQEKVVKNNAVSPLVSNSTVWELKGHSHQIADTGDYDGHYEITNGKISLLTKDDDDEALMPIIDALNNSGCKFYQDDWFEFENSMLKEEIKKLKFMIENGLGWKDMEKDISPMHDI